MLTKLFNLQRRAETSAETGHATCYHCGKAKHDNESVFCPECFPEPGSLPALIDERPEPRATASSRLCDILAFLIRPLRHAENVTKRLLACQREKIDLEQSNLALRRKCADLKAQRDGALEMLAQAGQEADIARRLLKLAERDRDDAYGELADIELRALKARNKSTEASNN